MADAIPQAAPANPVVAFPYTGDYRIDTLLEGLQYRWNAGAALGTSVAVTYSFMTVKPFYGGTDSGGDRGFEAFTVQQKEAARAIFSRLSAETGLVFTETSDAGGIYGQIRLGSNTQRSSAGYAYLPFSTGDDKSGDVWIDNTTSSTTFSLPPGSYAYATLVHEIGHALGLKHPGNYNAGEASSNTPGNYLGVVEDTTAYTIMSYTDAAGGLQRDWFGIYDLLTLRTLYGPGTASAGSSTYAYTDSAGASMTTLYDAGGTDTLNLSAVTVAPRVDLRPGAFSSFGKNGSAASSNNFSIDLSTTIENYVGGALNDVVTGNAANNVFTLGQGSNSADGGLGTDTAAYTGSYTSYSVTVSGGTLRIVGSNANDTFTNIERLAFVDRKVAFDANGLTTAKVLGAVFGRDAVSNLSYEGIGIGLLDSGMTYSALMQLAINARLGAGATNEAVVTLLYTNVIGTAPGAAELALYKGLLDTGSQTQGSLGVLAGDLALNATNIGLTGLAATGVAYTV